MLRYILCTTIMLIGITSVHVLPKTTLFSSTQTIKVLTTWYVGKSQCSNYNFFNLYNTVYCFAIGVMTWFEVGDSDTWVQIARLTTVSFITYSVIIEKSQQYRDFITDLHGKQWNWKFWAKGLLILRNTKNLQLLVTLGLVFQWLNISAQIWL